MKKAIVIGATSGIGRAIAKVLSENDYEVGVTGRRIELLESLQKELSGKSYIRKMDVTQIDEAMKLLQELFQEMGDVDLVVINAGIGIFSLDLNWDAELRMIQTNVTGFAALANVAFNYFRKRRNGHIVGISSIAALRGSGNAPAYNASKAFEGIYLEGLRLKALKLKRPITITDVKPGFVKTAILREDARIFWMASPEKAAKQILQAIRKKKRHVYITKRWRLVAWIAKLLPYWIHKKI